MGEVQIIQNWHQMKFFWNFLRLTKLLLLFTCSQAPGQQILPWWTYCFLFPSAILFFFICPYHGGSEHLPAMWETWVRSLGREDSLEKEMAIHSSTLAWKIPWTEEPDRLQSMGSQRVRHNWVTSLHFNTKWFKTKGNRKYRFKLKSMLYLAKVKHFNNDYKNIIICTDIYAVLKTQNYPI